MPINTSENLLKMSEIASFIEDISARIHLISINAAIESARTLAWFDNQLAGQEKLIKQLLKSSVNMSEPFYSDNKWRYYELKNKSDLQFSFATEAPDSDETFTL